MTAPTVDLVEAKARARALRATLAEQGVAISHAQALEKVAHEAGFADWNTLFAAIGNRPPQGWAVGQRLRGSYLGQPFEGRVITAEVTRPGWSRLTIDLDEAVDVVTFKSFSNFRKRISGVVGPLGESLEKTSDGQPHLVVGRGGEGG